MSEDIGHFKVVIEGEVSPKLGDNLEKGFKKSSEKVGNNLKKEIEKSIDKGIQKAKEFAKSFKIPSFGEIGGKLESFVGKSTKSAVSSGLASSAGGSTKGAAGGGMIEMASKLGVLIGIIMLVYDVLKSLAPIQAILKMVTAILQITLYPIAQVLLAIFKPVMLLFMKWLLLPMWNIMGKAKIEHTPEEEAKIKKNLEDWNNVVDAWNTFWSDISKIYIGELLANWFQELGNIFSNWCDNTWNTVVGWADGLVVWLEGLNESFGKWSESLNESFGKWSEDVWNTITGKLSELSTWLTKTWRTISGDFLKPLNDFKAWLIDTWDKMDDNLLKPLTDFKKWVNETWSKIENVIKDPLNKIFNWISTKIASLTSTIFGGGSSGSNYRGATGAIVTQPTMALIGEAGPEMVVPLNQSPGSSPLSSKMGSMGNTIIINNTFNDTKVTSKSDIDDIVAKIERTFYTNSKRSNVR